MVLSRRAKRLAERLGVAPDQVREIVEGNAKLAAEIVHETLERFVEQIKADSPSGSMKGYEVVTVSNSEKVLLAKSKISIAGQFDYLISVQASDSHQRQSINVFDILDAGRPALPARAKSYALWNASTGGESTRRVLAKGRGGRIAVGKTVSRGAIRPEPDRGTYEGDNKIIFRQGEIAAIPALKLYERAEKAAKDALAGQGFTNWDVIYVGPTAED